MIKVLFICHGSICRSPMAMFMMRNMVRKMGVEDDFRIDAAATSTEEIGNPVYPPARRKLNSEGINCEGHHARQLKKEDYREYDYLIGMDDMNIRNIIRIVGSDPDKKVYKLYDFADEDGGNIADPWYTDDFDTCYEQINEGLEAFVFYCLTE